MEERWSRGFDFFYQRRQTFFNAAIILGLLLAITAVGWISQRGSSLLGWIIAGTIGMLGAVILFTRLGRFEYGILAIALSAGLINFFTLPTGRESKVPVSMVISIGLVGVWLLTWLVSKGREKPRPSPINTPVFLFVGVNVVAYLWSLAFRDPLLWIWPTFPLVQLAALTVNVLLPLLAVMVVSKMKEVSWLERLTWTMIVMGAFVVIVELLRLPLNILFFNGTRGLFAMWIGVLAYSMALFDEKLPVWKRVLLFLLVAAWLYNNFARAAFWLSGWVPLVAGLVLVTFTRSKKLFLALSLVGILVIAIKFDYFYQRIYVANVEEGSSGRVSLWRTNFQLVTRHPLLGVGPAGYAIYYMTYHPENSRSTHNNYFDVLSQTGFIGFGIFLWLFSVFLLIGNRTRLLLSGKRDFEEGFANATLAGGAAATVSMMLGDWVLPFAYNQTITGFDNAAYTWIFLGAMVSLYLAVKDRIRK